MGDVSLVSIKTQKQRKSCCSYISTLMTIYNDINQDCRSRLSRWKFCTFDAWSQLRCHKLSQSVIAQKRYSVTLKSLDQAIDLVYFRLFWMHRHFTLNVFAHFEVLIDVLNVSYVILYANFAFDVSSPALVFSILKEHHPSSSFRRFVIVYCSCFSVILTSESVLFQTLDVLLTFSVLFETWCKFCGSVITDFFVFAIVFLSNLLYKLHVFCDYVCMKIIKTN